MFKHNAWTRLATCYPLGFIPVAPGTFGSLPGLVLAFAVQYFVKSVSRDLLQPPALLLLILAVVLFVVLTWVVIAKAAPHFPQHDDGRIVIDEVAGQMLTVIFFPLSWPLLLCGFVLFRLFDIVKPWPISYFDSAIKTSFGVLFDDLLAGAMAAAIIWIIKYKFNVSLI